MTRITLTRKALTRIGIAAAALVALFGASYAIGTVGSDAAHDGAAADAFRNDGAIVRGFTAPESSADSGRALASAADDAAIAQQELPFGDRVIREADLTVEVDGDAFDRAWQQAFDIARRFDGNVLSSSRGSGDVVPVRDDDAAFGTITVRVPSDRFEGALNAMRDLGEVTADRTSAQDVTEEYVDLSSRLRNLRAQEEALLRLMRRADSVQDILLVQRELANVQAEIERVTGRVNYLEARTEFSRITLTLAEPGALLVTTGEEGPSFAKAWETAVEGLARMATAAMIGLLWLAPFVAIGAVILWGLRRRPAPTPAP